MDNETILARVRMLQAGVMFRAKFTKANGDIRIMRGTVTEFFDGPDRTGNIRVVEAVTNNFRTIKINKIIHLEVV